MRYLPRHDSHNGLLHFPAAQSLPGYWRYWPSADLAVYIEHYWTIEWDLAEPVRRETLPYPSAHIVLEPGVVQLSGVQTQKFSRVLTGKSRVLGAKFRPGGLRAFVAAPVSTFTDRVIELHAVFGSDAKDLDQRVLAHTDHHAAIGALEAFLRGRAPRPDPQAALAGRIAERIASDRQLCKVEQLVSEFGVGVRTLQRLLGEYVGVSPKWMIRRYRLQETAERIAAATHVDWAAIALELGYSDQPHLIRDFKRLIGQSPADYFKALTATSAGRRSE